MPQRLQAALPCIITPEAVAAIRITRGHSVHPVAATWPRQRAYAALDVLFQAGLIVASILRAVDYLNARPDVDPDRICVMSGQNLFFEVRPIVAELAMPC